MRPDVEVVQGRLWRVLDDNPNLATESTGRKIPGIKKPANEPAMGGNIAILFILCLLQGIPIGLAEAIPMMLQNRGDSYKQQVRVGGWAGDASYLDGVDIR
ncbi:conserved hypothetical protein [Culex quinquefasciatus]|uniref:Uncharacterized protein n=1 Tax=Culex quinquefasciatus TaxID=7176 RepID=B0WU50_CULQU|nr:conserved hypothetical protein [Culex quinquefasciatus]|eukprot:XP_001870901.1 conserved hypothetical protein [Culex quinquefasciatus]